MRIESILPKLEIYGVATVAVVLVSGLALALSGPFSLEDYGLTDTSAKAPHSASTSSSASQELQPALLEPALRSLDGVAYHG